MLTCGFYDEAGEFAFEVGLPGKSGVGGGIVALLPNQFVISAWSPGLNEKGNSKLGMYALERFTTISKHALTGITAPPFVDAFSMDWAGLSEKIGRHH